jgi:trehalose 6-phosphate synthase/phosphatase
MDRLAGQQQIAEELQKSNCYPVFLTQKQIDEYYNGYSNSILWPIFHDNPVGEAARGDVSQLWKAYQKVNATFAEAVLALSNKSEDIWVHDYQLMTLPALLRRERPDDKIGFFLHIPFPEPKNFAKIEQGDVLLAGMLGADLVGLQTETNVNRFLENVQALGVGDTAHHKVILADRVVRVTNFPIGIDYKKYEKARKSRAVSREYAKLKVQYAGLKVILMVDRLDLSKNLVNRARAYQMLLRENPQLRSKVVLIMQVMPSRMDIAEHQKLQRELEKIVKETNNEFGMLPWTPIEYIFRPLPFEQVTALYRRADVAFIAPKRDGMNLVAKEYLASKPGKGGVLVLSKTAGAAEELKEAVMVDPLRPKALVKGLSKALAMPAKELNRRATTMQQQLSTHTIQSWAKKFIHTLNTDLPAPGTLRTLTLNKSRLAEMQAAYNSARSRLLLLDYDGVLMGFHRKFEDATPTPKLRSILAALAQDKLNKVVVISGRTQTDLQEWFADMPVTLVAEHGAFWREPNGRWHPRESQAIEGWQERIMPVLERYAKRTPGALVEQKEQSLVWHYRLAKPYYAQKNLVALKRVLKPLTKRLGLQAQQGNMILEVRPDGIDKGSTAKIWLADKPGFILAIGDDYTDEDTFKAVPASAYTIKVGRGRTSAHNRLGSVAAVRHLLEKLASD